MRGIFIYLNQKQRLLPLGLALVFFISLSGCKKTTQEPEGPLPILGAVHIDENGDTTYYAIPDYAFVDQDSNLIVPDTFAGKIYVADFFFTTCPTICPIMKKEMVRVYDAFLDEPRVRLLSHSIDPAHDSVAVLKRYATALGIQTPKWHMVTGDKDEIYTQARAYMVSALDDPTAPGGIVHSGAFILIDGNRHVRGFYDGTKTEEVDELMADIKRLLDE